MRIFFYYFNILAAFKHVMHNCYKQTATLLDVLLYTACGRRLGDIAINNENRNLVKAYSFRFLLFLSRGKLLPSELRLKQQRTVTREDYQLFNFRDQRRVSR